MDSGQSICGPCLMKEVMGWTTAIAGGLYFSSERLLGRWLTRRNRRRDCVPRLKINHSVAHGKECLFGMNRSEEGVML